MNRAFESYLHLVKKIGPDGAAYALPQATRGTLLASATPYQWKHMISQRTCSRASLEIQYVMMHVWANLYDLDPVYFSPETTGPNCLGLGCLEGKMQCDGGFGGYDTRDPRELITLRFGDIPSLRNRMLRGETI
jgi:hypothetical protein